MVEQFEVENNAPKAAPEHHSWSEAVSDLYHSAMRSVGFEKEEPKHLEFKKLDLTEFKRLNPPGEMSRMEYGESIRRIDDPCMRQFFSKARIDPDKIDASCFKKAMADETKEQEKK